MKINKIDDLDLYQMGFEIRRIGNRAINKVKKENRQLGLPLIYSKNGVIYYEMPDGTITTRSPFPDTE